MRSDGTMNVVRLGQTFWQTLNPYQHLLTVSWGQFFIYVLILYGLANILFAGLYMLAGQGAIQGAESPDLAARWQNAFFFSVQTIATIGYGQMTPKSPLANLLVALEALTGLMGFALMTGILFARFSRPTAHILHSEIALIAPYKEITALMFRVANATHHQLIELKATVTFSRMETKPDGRPVRRFYTLPLERDTVVLLPTQWVVVHPIDEQSPLYGKTGAILHETDPEIFVMIAAMEETFNQNVYARFSYADDEIVCGARFADIFGKNAQGVVTIDVSRLSEYESVKLLE